MVDYIVMYSGGLTSFESARRAIDRHGKDKVRVWFADTQTEDEDLYRFNKDVERILDIEIEVLDQGESVWGLFKRMGFIGNSRYDPCSDRLKRKPLRRKLKEEYPNPKDAVVILGMDDVEDCNRWKRAAAAQAPYEVWFPLMDDGWPPARKPHIKKWLEENGIAQPRLYDLGFQHNNCGGFCIKAGLGQFAHLYKTMPERYLEHERNEKEVLEIVKEKGRKYTTILKDTRGGESTPLSLEDFRLRLEAGETFHYEPAWSCMCFVDLEGVEWL